mmetsp:Transcript_2417/g.5438  ORF Transcript_2417/g.5438 Transcript_2417/m.5438 type:complete len:473 (-) Transcript_2417:80-1498(-)
MGLARGREARRRGRVRDGGARGLRGDGHAGAGGEAVVLRCLPVRGRGGERLPEPRGRGLLEQALGLAWGVEEPPVQGQHVGRQGGLARTGARRAGLVADVAGAHLCTRRAHGAAECPGCDERLPAAAPALQREELGLHRRSGQQSLACLGALWQLSRLGPSWGQQAQRRGRLRDGRARDVRGDGHEGPGGAEAVLQRLQVRDLGLRRLPESRGRGLLGEEVGVEGGVGRLAVPRRHVGRQARALEAGSRLFFAVPYAVSEAACRAARLGRRLWLQDVPGRGLLVFFAAVPRRQGDGRQRGLRVLAARRVQRRRACGCVRLQAVRRGGLVLDAGQVQQRRGDFGRGGMPVQGAHAGASTSAGASARAARLERRLRLQDVRGPGLLVHVAAVHCGQGDGLQGGLRVLAAARLQRARGRLRLQALRWRGLVDDAAHVQPARGDLAGGRVPVPEGGGPRRLGADCCVRGRRPCART